MEVTSVRGCRGRVADGRDGARLFHFGVELEDSPGFFEVEEVSVDDKLPFPGVGRYLVDTFDGVAVVSKLLDD